MTYDHDAYKKMKKQIENDLIGVILSKLEMFEDDNYDPSLSRGVYACKKIIEKLKN